MATTRTPDPAFGQLAGATFICLSHLTDKPCQPIRPPVQQYGAVYSLLPVEANFYSIAHIAATPFFRSLDVTRRSAEPRLIKLAPYLVSRVK
jgi:hypothetical protein